MWLMSKMDASSVKENSANNIQLYSQRESLEFCEMETRCFQAPEFSSPSTGPVAGIQ